MAVFKPCDEEFAGVVVADASSSIGSSSSSEATMERFELGRPNPNYPGLRLGEGALRERAAFVLDRNYGCFSGVPTTQLTRIKPAAGSSFLRAKRPHGHSHDEAETAPAPAPTPAPARMPAPALSIRRGNTVLSLSPPAPSLSPFSSGGINEEEEEDQEAAVAAATAAEVVVEMIEGSMQQFVTYETTAGDVSINALPACEVRKIAILDMCVCGVSSAGLWWSTPTHPR